MAKQPDRPPGKRIKRGRLHFTEDEAAAKSGPSTSGQVGPKPKSTGKFKQDEEREKPSSRLRTEDRQAGEATADDDTGQKERTATGEKKSKQEKRFEKAQAKAEHALSLIHIRCV